MTQQPAHPPASPRAPRILVVDDEEGYRDVHGIMLTAAGYELRTAVSAADALEVIPDWRPDVIVSDLMMPGVRGTELAARLRADPATGDIPILLVSSLADRNTQSHALSSGASAFLAKPVRREELVTLVGELLAASRRASS